MTFIVDDAHDLSLEHLMLLKEVTDQGRLQYDHPLGLCLVAAGRGDTIPLKETFDLPDPTWLQFRRRFDKLAPFCRVASHTSEEVRDILATLEQGIYHQSERFLPFSAIVCLAACCKGPGRLRTATKSRSMTSSEGSSWGSRWNSRSMSSSGCGPGRGASGNQSNIPLLSFVVRKRPFFRDAPQERRVSWIFFHLETGGLERKKPCSLRYVGIEESWFLSAARRSGLARWKYVLAVASGISNACPISEKVNCPS